jgi:hypothetical protein
MMARVSSLDLAALLSLVFYISLIKMRIIAICFPLPPARCETARASLPADDEELQFIQIDAKRKLFDTRRSSERRKDFDVLLPEHCCEHNS